MAWYQQWRPYVPVAKRRANAAAHAARLAKKQGRALAPVRIEGRIIARSFWGKAWCDHLERYSDFANRLPRGRTYVRNGSVIDLQIARGKVTAIVSGSAIYTVTISIKTLAKDAWTRIKQDSARSVDSLIDLLQGRFDQAVMQRLTDPKQGLFPQPDEISMRCSCPDYATLCKHVAAVLYGVGARLDQAPEMLFTLRHVDHQELVHQAVAAENLERTLSAEQDASLAGADLGALFGIDLAGGTAAPQKATRRRRSQDASEIGKAPSKADNGAKTRRKAPVAAKAAAKNEPAPKRKRTAESERREPATQAAAGNGRSTATKRRRAPTASAKKRKPT